MDYLDPKKHKAHLVRLAIGYILIGIALILTAVILLYRAYGFGIKNGEVIQNGLIFISSRPVDADIYINDERNKEQTNARLLMQAGQYRFELRRDGYRPWKRAINVEGGALVRFDYPVLFPTTLQTETTKQYDTRPSLLTQSLDRRWVVVQAASSFNTFDLYDLDEDEDRVAPDAFTVPRSIFTLTGGKHSWEVVEWADNNRHVLLKHITSDKGKTLGEFILVDRENPTESVNLTRRLGVNPTELRLRDKKHDSYYVYTQNNRRLATATLDERTLRTVQDNVLDFKTHGDDVVLYATSEGAAKDKTAIKLREGDRTYTIRQVGADANYLLDLARYEDNWYAVVGSSSDDRSYVYRNPASALRDDADAPLVPVQVFKVPQATYVSFSDNARFVMAQSGQKFGVYDAENDRGYAYATTASMDAPQKQGRWMDGHRLLYVSEGKTLVFDFDNANSELLSAADGAYTPAFDRDFRNLYSVSQQKAEDGKATYLFSRTSLLTPEDQ
jgi:hypothetical protein